MKKTVKNDYYKALLHAEKLWAWLADNPLKTKLDYPQYNRSLIYLRNACAVCEFHRVTKRQYCSECFLCEICASLYHDWKEAQWVSDEQSARDNAMDIWRAIFEERLRVM